MDLPTGYTPGKKKKVIKITINGKTDRIGSVQA